MKCINFWHVLIICFGIKIGERTWKTIIWIEPLSFYVFFSTLKNEIVGKNLNIRKVIIIKRKKRRNEKGSTKKRIADFWMDIAADQANVIEGQILCSWLFIILTLRRSHFLINVYFVECSICFFNILEDFRISSCAFQCSILHLALKNHDFIKQW